MVTKGGYLRGSGPYRTSKTMGWGATKLYKKFNIWERGNVGIYIMY